MSMYTTGEVAKLCGVSVRTVQYYDSRNILVPSQLSEGGRRLYSEDDLERMRIICFLREMGFSLDNIGQLFGDEKPETVICLLIEQQEKALQQEAADTQKKLDKLTDLKRGLKQIENFSLNSLGDIAHIMKNHNKRKKMLALMLAVGIVMDLIAAGAVLYGVKAGIWWPLMMGLPIVIGLGVGISVYYCRHAAYICSRCHHCFQPKFGEMFWAAHTPNTRRLTCPSCGHKSFCVETYMEKG